MKRKPFFKSRILAMALCVALVSFLTPVGTFAWLFNTSGSVTNDFEPGRITTVVEETLEGGAKTNVKIQNTGNIPAYIRVALIPAWVDAEGNILAQEASLDDCAVTWGSVGTLATDEWFIGSDGFYYCKTAIYPNQSTPVLIQSCTVDMTGQAEGVQFELQIVSSAIQSLPTTTVESVWPVAVVNGLLGPRGGN